MYIRHYIILPKYIMAEIDPNSPIYKEARQFAENLQIYFNVGHSPIFQGMVPIETNIEEITTPDGLDYSFRVSMEISRSNMCRAIGMPGSTESNEFGRLLPRTNQILDDFVGDRAIEDPEEVRAALLALSEFVTELTQISDSYPVDMEKFHDAYTKGSFEGLDDLRQTLKSLPEHRSYDNPIDPASTAGLSLREFVAYHATIRGMILNELWDDFSSLPQGLGGSENFERNEEVFMPSGTQRQRHMPDEAVGIALRYTFHKT